MRTAARAAAVTLEDDDCIVRAMTQLKDKLAQLGVTIEVLLATSDKHMHGARVSCLQGRVRGLVSSLDMLCALYRALACTASAHP